MSSCIITPRTAPDALRAYLSDLFAANVLRGSPIIPESNEFYVVNNDYAVAEEFRSFADQMLRELDDTQNCDDNLIKSAAQYGVFPSPGKYATGYVQLTGAAGTPLPPDLTAVIGTNSYTRAPYATSSQAIGPDGNAVVMFRANSPGAAQNNTTGSAAANLLGSFDGIDNNVTVLGAGFTNGADPETIDQFRARFLARKKYLPQGNWQWMVETLMDWGGVSRVCPKTTSCNTGRLEAYVMFDGTFPNGLAPDSVNQDLTAWMFGSPNGMGLGRAAIGVFGKFFTAQAAPVDVMLQGLGCLTSTQLTRLRKAINGLFLTLCPEQTLCKRLIEALIVTIAGANCAPIVTFTTLTAAATISNSGDAVPMADHLITLNNLATTK